MRLGLARARRTAGHLESAVGVHHGCDPGGDRDNAPGLADFDVDRFEPEIRNFLSIGREREAFTHLSMSPPGCDTSLLLTPDASTASIRSSSARVEHHRRKPLGSQLSAAPRLCVWF